MTHFELCKITANRFLKESHIVLYDYQCSISREFPDVLCFKDYDSKVFEIKISRNDFKADVKKYCRAKYRIKYSPKFNYNGDMLKDIDWRSFGLQEFIREAPHLGKFRYYVCPWGLIEANDIKNGWGLYWVKNGRFYKKKESVIFRCDVHTELAIIVNALRKYYSCHGSNILIKKYL